MVPFPIIHKIQVNNLKYSGSLLSAIQTEVNSDLSYIKVPSLRSKMWCKLNELQQICELEESSKEIVECSVSETVQTCK